MIAVWSDVTGRGTEVELHTLYGSHVWNLHLNAGIVDVHRRPDGIFLERDEDGIPRYRQVSAVAAIRTGSTAGEVGDSFLVYHNPHATNPLDPLALPDLNQFVAEKMIWTKGDPDG